MSTSSTSPNSAARHLIDQRLDALDQALLGLVPRSDRLAVVAQVETRIRELASANPPVELVLQPMIPQPALPSFSAITPAGRKRSRLAISAGVLGIVALVLLFGIPVTYLVVATIGELFGEIVSMSLLGAHLLAVVIGGLLAAALGTAALITLSRRTERLAGHGWAIAGLCTGPVAMLAAGSVLIIGGFEMFAAEGFIGAPIAVSEPSDEAMPLNTDDCKPEDSDADEPDTRTATTAPAAVSDALIKAAVDFLAAVPEERKAPGAYPVYAAPSANEPATPAAPEEPTESDE
jgi:uncharacterized integral membrane protein